MGEELQHYGVLGMKWGVRKDPQAAKGKADEKLRKLDRKASVQTAKAQRRMEKAWTAQNRAEGAILFKGLKNWSASGRTRKAMKSYAKLQKTQSKAMRWAKAMEKTFRNTNVRSIDNETAALGQKWASMTIDDLMRNNVTMDALYNTRSRTKTRMNF